MRYASFLCLLCVITAVLCSCREISDKWKIVRLTGEPKSITVALDDSGEIGLSVDLNFTNGGSNTITVLPTADGESPYAVMTYPSDLDDWGLTATLINGILTVDTEKECQFSTDAFSMTIYANVTSYDLVGSCTLNADHGSLSAEHLSLNITGGAAVAICNAAAKAVTVHINGAADVVMAGTAEALDIEINGAGALDTVGLQVRDASVVINGVGAAKLACTDALDTEINGTGSISYKGNPTLTKDINGLGTVTQIPDDAT